jgi:hypothetical protein
LFFDPKFGVWLAVGAKQLEVLEPVVVPVAVDVVEA